MQSFTRRFGEEAATEALNFSRAHVYALKKVVEEEGIDCEFELRRSYDVFCNDDEAEAARQYVRASQAAGRQWTDDVALVEEKLVEQVSTEELILIWLTLKMARSPLSKALELRPMFPHAHSGRTNSCLNWPPSSWSEML